MLLRARDTPHRECDPTMIECATVIRDTFPYEDAWIARVVADMRGDAPIVFQPHTTDTPDKTVSTVMRVSRSRRGEDAGGHCDAVRDAREPVPYPRVRAPWRRRRQWSAP